MDSAAIKFKIRRATFADVDEIAAVHLDSIRSIGARYYQEEIANDWGAQVTGELYVNAMAGGESFFIAVDQLGGRCEALGFSSHRIERDESRTAVYVRGKAVRLGIGSALFRAAESAAITAGATRICVDASLAAVEFYRAIGFKELGRGEHRLLSGRRMACVFMRKNLAGPNLEPPSSSGG
jgi:putative acetyltransferase